MSAPERCNILGVGVHALDMDAALKALDTALANRRKGYVCVTGVHGVMEAQRDPVFRRILNRALLNVPDGVPLVWVARALGHTTTRRVYGPDLMLALCRQAADRGQTHFLYGGGPGVADALADRLRNLIPTIQIVGTYTPPFRPLRPDEEQDLVDQVSRARPDIFWVGLSTPKQEKFMAGYLETLDTTVMLGVGAAFDFHLGRLKDSPAWVKRAGLQWLHRLIQEPRRLWKRYLTIVPSFLLLIILQLTGLKRYSLD